MFIFHCYRTVLGERKKKRKKKKITLCRLKCHIWKKFWRDTYICKVKNHHNLRKQTTVFQCFLYVFALCISGNKVATAVRKPFPDFAVNIVLIAIWFKLDTNCNTFWQNLVPWEQVRHEECLPKSKVPPVIYWKQP